MESGQIAIHRGLANRGRFFVARSARELQSPGLEGFDVRLVDLIETEICPGTECQLTITLPIELDRALLFRFGGGDPLVKSRLELAQG